MARWWPFGRGKAPVEPARESAEAPASVARVTALPVEPAAVTTLWEVPARRYCVITRVKGGVEHHSICTPGLSMPVGAVTVTTGHWVE